MKLVTRLPFYALAVILALLAVPSRALAQTNFANIGLTQGWITFGQAVPQGVIPNGSAIQVGTLATQTDVKNRWADGSIRFAILTVNVPTSGTYPLHVASIPSGTMTPALPTASAALKIGTTTYTATLPGTPSSDTWLSGPLAYEGRSIVAPTAPNNAPHPFLRVIFDTRVYNDGTARVDMTVENVLDLAGAATVTYDATLRVNGVAVFSKTAVEHYYLTRWRKAFITGGTFADITPDLAPFNTANAIPPYLSLVRNQINTPTGATYEILREGALERNMPAHSGRQEIAPYPDWTARYLVHKNLTQRAFVLANGDLSGSWPIHMRERESGTRTGVGAERFISVDERPTFWLDDRAAAAGWDTMAGTPLPMHEYGNIIPGPGQTALIPDVAHQPSLAFVPYLLTGDRYYADEMAFWAFYCMLRTYPGDGTRSNTGIVANNETRGFGWALRNMADAAAYFPETSPVRAHLVQKVQNNLGWIDAYAAARFTPSNPFKVLWTGLRPEGPQFISLWEQTYLGIAIDRANQHGFTGGLGARDAIANLQLKLFTSEPDYPRVSNLGCSVGVTSCPWSAPYLVNVGVPVPAPGTGLTFYQTIGEIAANTVGNPDLQREYAGFYGPEARLNLMRAIQSGQPRAQEAYDYLQPFIATAPAFCASDGASIPDLACRAGWAVDFATGTAPPPPPPPPATAVAQLLTPASGAAFTSSVQSFSWTAGTGVTSYQLAVGSTQGASNFYAGAETFAQSAVVGGLPVTGSTVWVRLSSKINGTFQAVDYSFTSYTAPLPPAPVDPLAATIVGIADGNSSVETPPFNTKAGDLLVAFVSSSGPDGVPETMTVVGGSLTWTRVARANAQNGVAEIWWATTPTALTGVTVLSNHTREHDRPVAGRDRVQQCRRHRRQCVRERRQRRPVGLADGDEGGFAGLRRRQRLERRGSPRARHQPGDGARSARRQRRHLLDAAPADDDACRRSARHDQRRRPDRSQLEHGRDRDHAGGDGTDQADAVDHLVRAGRHPQGHGARRVAVERDRERARTVRLHAARGNGAAARQRPAAVGDVLSDRHRHLPVGDGDGADQRASTTPRRR